MFKTELCDLLGIEYPIIQGGMVWICYHELCSAVSEAGGLGILAAGGMTVEELKKEIELVKGLTKKPFGVNIPLMRPDAEDLIDAVIAGGANVISTSAGSPKRFTGKIHDAGLKVIHVSPNVSLAEKGAHAGVDAIVVEGIEAGGHDGFDEITTVALVPQTVDRVSIPVVAAGGIADGRGFVAALALGAKGVQVGTRFAATHEARAHPKFKEAILNVTDTGTILTARTIAPVRSVKNSLTERINKAEMSGATAEELADLIGEGRSQLASQNGDIDEGTVYCGQIGGMITRLKHAGDVVREMIGEAEAIVKGLGSLVGS
ncbi:MAG: nitronate monooxygenase [Deltaproteobacteria bacterium]|uniref:Nitronate monooxygenase n=1 Tax=Candidatus Zymogenus saltonus TaxID=2844893 RepID=A0A9D8KCL9_9DELT|nr:nitronate monooxygenase [Candidatus Zymogenus saltonus]